MRFGDWRLKEAQVIENLVKSVNSVAGSFGCHVVSINISMCTKANTIFQLSATAKVFRFAVGTMLLFVHQMRPSNPVNICTPEHNANFNIPRTKVASSVGEQVQF